MSRRARFTIIEHGASPTAWVSSPGLGTDDWLVVAQQSDETVDAFCERVQRRARRLGKNSYIQSIDVYTARADDEHGAVRRATVEALGAQLAEGGRLTLWSPTADARTDAELAIILAQLTPAFAKRHVAVGQQGCAQEEPSGVRHATPSRTALRRVDNSNVENVG